MARGTRDFVVRLAMALSVALCPTPTHSLELEFGLEVSRTVFQFKGLQHVVAMLCHQQDAVRWEREFADHDLTFIATPAISPDDVLWTLRSSQTSLGILLHAGCEETHQLLLQSSAAGLLDGGRGLHWLLVGNSTTSRPELEQLADTLDLGPDSQVTLAATVSTGHIVHLVDAYRAVPGPPGPGRPLLTALMGTWSKSRGLTALFVGRTAARRRNLMGSVLKTGVLVNHFRNADLARALGKPKDNSPLVSAVVAFSHTLVMHLQDMLNISLRLQGGSFHGHLRRLSRNEIQLLSTVTHMDAKYWDVLEYTAVPLWTERRVLILKNPSALWSSNAWMRPLDTNVWIVMLVLILLAAIVLRAVGYWEVQFDLGHVQEEDSWASAITTALSIVCDQGFTTTTEWASGRIMLLVYEFFSLFLTLFYTSGIVTFLLTFPPPFARTVLEVIDSPFIVGVDEAVFSRHNFTESRDPLIQELYNKKIEEEAGGGGFLSLMEAGKAARTSSFAFVGSPLPAYKMMSSSWTQSDICRMQEIPLMPSGLLAMATTKRSPFREVLNQAILMLVERGQLARERIRWSELRPRCQLSDVTELDYVGLRQVAPLLGFVVSGLALSLIFLAFEIVSSKYQDRKSLFIVLLKKLTTPNIDASKKAA